MFFVFVLQKDNVKKDVIKGLRITNCCLFHQSMNRSNLKWVVKKRSKNHIDEIASLVNGEYQNKCGIIYCLARKEVDETVAKLKNANVDCVGYHAGMPNSEKEMNQELWTTDRKRLIVATNAFGMGINKYDVRFVIHTCMPKSVEDYYQQAGRAGRDNSESLCLLFYSTADRFRVEFLISGTEEAKARPDELSVFFWFFFVVFLSKLVH